MLKRYGTDEKGHVIKRADVYTRDEHGISLKRIDSDALKICRRLKSNGFATYIVGGAVRDLIAGKIPKDFDIVTEAKPNQIRRLFRNSRVIGKRFRLVHIFFHDKIIEVSTFRAKESTGHNNVFGTMEEDVWRRDFSHNALYYDALDEHVVDYVDGVKHIRQKKLVAVIPHEKIFIEDPVRMIRAVKYSTALGLKIPFFLSRRIKKDASLLKDCSRSRISEEIFKILEGGAAQGIMLRLQHLGLLQYILPRINREMIENQHFNLHILSALEQLDHHRADDKPLERWQCIMALIKPIFEKMQADNTGGHNFSGKDIFDYAKEFLQPFTPPNRDVEQSVTHIYRRPKRKRRGPRKRKRTSNSGSSERKKAQS